jgi:hypothetical protein
MADTDDVNASGSTASVSADSSSAAAAASLGFILVARIAFADYQVGDEITDEDEINDILAGELAVYVIKRAA